MITVWCMNTGGHAPREEVYTLRRQVDRHLKEKHIFQCITEQEMLKAHTIKPINDLPGWWGKTNLFNLRNSHPRNLWLDLDVTITKDIDDLVKPLNGSQLRIAKNWAKSGHGGCQSSVMYWEGASAEIISNEFDHADAHWPPINKPGILWGDQEWITELRDAGRLNVEYFKPHQVVSYKYHCRNGLPKDSLIQVFHGKPDPGECNEDWIKQCRA